ncbi:hypothetical protein M5689_023042 [Euphorbia peplus]|nr:hypothetical protein M5689_023042 [Euphorbia peplus]
MLSMEKLFDAFPKLSLLNLRSGAWSEMETCFLSEGLQSHSGMKEVKQIVAQLVIHDVGNTLSFLFAILDKCTNLADVALLIQREVDPNIASSFISRCAAEHPKVRWSWGMWREGSKDTWISNGI